MPSAFQCPDGSPPPCPGIASGARAGSVAVLYFAARDSADAYLADGLTEDLTTLLARQRALVVKPTSSVRLAQRRQPAAAARSLGQQLNVRWVVHGSLRRAGERVRLNVELIETGADRSVWGQTYDRTAEALLDLPGELADEVRRRIAGTPVMATAPVGAIGLPAPPTTTAPSAPSARPAPSSLAREAVWGTRNPAALDHFRRGNWLLATRVREAEAIREYQEAARLDPGFTSAVARSAYALALLWNRVLVEGGRGDTVSYSSQGMALATTALRMDSTNSDAWMALGFLRALGDMRSLGGAEQAFERAIAFDSTNAEAWHQYAQILAFLGDDSAAVRASNRALALEPARAISLADQASYVYFGFQDVARAYALIDSSLAINPDYVFGRFLRGLLHLRLGRAEAAMIDAHALGEGDSLIGPVRALRAAAFAMRGDTTRARATAQPWLRPNAGGQVWGAIAMMALGDNEWAVQHLEGIPPAGRDAALWSFLRLPEFNPLRSIARFRRVYLDSRPVGARAP